jgi:membrane protein DedA with SNARE-associated domain
MAEPVEWYASIFLWLFITGIGIPPVPEEAGILYASGVHALHPEVSWPFAWLACGLGILCADCLLYGIGRWWGPKLFQYAWMRRILNDERRIRIESKIHAHGMKLLLLARFLPPLRTGVFLISGASRYRFVKFIAADAIYCVVGVGLLFFGGTGLLNLIKRVGHDAAWFLAIPVIGFGLYRYYRHLKRREKAPALSVSGLKSPVDVAPVEESRLNLTGAAPVVCAPEVTLQTPTVDR